MHEKHKAWNKNKEINTPPVEKNQHFFTLSVGLFEMFMSINNINLGAALINCFIWEPFNGNWSSVTMIRLVSLVPGLRSLSKSQQQFITAEERYSREDAAGVWFQGKVLCLFHFRLGSVGSCQSLQRNISVSVVSSLILLLRSKI